MAEKGVVLFSGGWESTALLPVAVRDHGRENTRAAYFDYGQPFIKEEVHAARVICDMYGVPFKSLFLPRLPSINGVYSARNIRMMLAAVDEFKPDVLYVGARAPSPLFDRYGDSNASTLISVGKSLGVRVVTLRMTPKWLVKTMVPLGLRPCIYSTQEKG